MEMRTTCMERLPIPDATEQQRGPVIQGIQTPLANSSSSEVPRLEIEIKKLVYARYGFTPDKIESPEGA